MSKFIRVLDGDGDLINIDKIHRISIELLNPRVTTLTVKTFALKAHTKNKKYCLLASGSLEFCQQKMHELQNALGIVDFMPLEERNET